MSQLLHRSIAELKQQVLSEGELVQDAIAKSIESLLDRNKDLACAVIADDDRIDQAEIHLEDQICRLLALFQPVAIDLRLIVGVLKINHDLERMGDLAKKIARRVVSLTKNEPMLELPQEFRDIAAQSQLMARQSLEAFLRDDVALAYQVRAADSQIDALRRQIDGHIERQLIEHPDQTKSLLCLGSVARHFERLADTATHVAEEVIHIVEGRIVRHER
jgi:phosphate transport system protein